MVDIQEPIKKISIIGTHNKYEMKKILNKDAMINKEPKKRMVTKNWTFSDEYFEYENQLQIVRDILNNSIHHLKIENKNIDNNELMNVSKIVIQEINKKISGYKQQDIIKKKIDRKQFITFESVIKKMFECELKCRYCTESMNILYDISRESKQWSVDRIDNDIGHNINNFHLACLDCNLKRRRRTDEKFLFTKQLNIIKQDTS
jgi:hypothetical protein